MRKGISPLIATVITIVIIVSAISMVLYIGKPAIDRSTESAVINEASLNMKAIDGAVREVASEGVSSSRTVSFKVSDGNYKIVNGTGVFFEKELSQQVYSFNTITFDGYVKSGAGINPLGLVGFWKFDEGTGTVANDSSGNKNDGTITGASWTTGNFQNALSFSGNGNNVSVSDSSTLNISSSLSLVLWEKPTASNMDNTVDVVGKGQCGTSNFNELLTFTNAANNIPRFFVAGLTATSVDAVNSLSSGTWYHVAGAFDGSNLKIYVNGILQNSVAATGNPTLNSKKLVIGGCDGASGYFTGGIDEVKLYSRALSPEEVKDAFVANPKHYYIAIDYDRIQIIGSDTFQKGMQKLCVQKIGESGNKAVVQITLC